MQLSEFTFELPDELIARFPATERDHSRLLHLDSMGSCHDHIFKDLSDFIDPEDCLIFNNTKVIPARLLGQRESGGKVELLIERILDNNRVLTQVKSSNRLPAGTKITVGEFELSVIDRQEPFYIVEVIQGTVEPLLQQQGHMPLPPYIDRADSSFDENRYQTVYATDTGAVAAPTAGLHFSDELMKKLADKGVAMGFVTLHVGSGTFAPIRANSIHDHKMHSEWYTVGADVVDLVQQTKAKGGRVFAVGTTSVRCLESAALSGELTATSGETDIFIFPGYEFKIVDRLITNFHLPESTLLLLVSAFSGQDNILKAYRHAVQENYRFFSYGDAMLLEPKAIQTLSVNEEQ